MAKPTDKASVIDLSDITSKPRSAGVSLGGMLGQDSVRPKAALTRQHDEANSETAQENRQLIKERDALTEAAANAQALKVAAEEKSKLESERADAATRLAQNAVFEKELAQAKASEFDGALPVRALDTASIRRSQWANRNEDEFNSPEFSKLRDEIRNAGGNTQPIKVRKIARVLDGQAGESEGVLDGQAVKQGVPVEYEIVFGHRRHQACIESGLPVNAIISESMTDLELFEAMERENRGRKNLSAWEQGKMYQDALTKGLYPSARKLFDSLGVNDSDGTRAIQLAKLPLEVVKAFPTRLDLQYRWAKPLTDAVAAKPDVVLAEAKAIADERKGGTVLSAVDVFNRLVGIEATKAVAHLIKAGGGKTFIRTEKGGQISYQFEKLEKSKRDQIEKLIKEVLAG